MRPARSDDAASRFCHGLTSPRSRPNSLWRSRGSANSLAGPRSRENFLSPPDLLSERSAKGRSPRGRSLSRDRAYDGRSPRGRSCSLRKPSPRGVYGRLSPLRSSRGRNGRFSPSPPLDGRSANGRSPRPRGAFRSSRRGGRSSRLPAPPRRRLANFFSGPRGTPERPLPPERLPRGSLFLLSSRGMNGLISGAGTNDVHARSGGPRRILMQNRYSLLLKAHLLAEFLG